MGSGNIVLMFACGVAVLQLTSGTCPAGMLGYNGNCYDLMSEKMTFDGASARCAYNFHRAGHEDGYIAEIDDRAEFEFVHDIFDSFSEQTAMWMGARRPANGGRYDFRLPSTNDVAPFTDWRTSQPYKGCPDCDCAYVNKGHGYKWDDDSCNTTMAFFCEYDMGGN